MAYDFQPVWHDPPSNRWFGFQAWSMERVAEYYNVTGNAQAKQILDAWVPWVVTNTQLNANGTYAIPNDLEWSGTPSASFSSATGTPAANPGLHVTVVNRTNDLGVAGSLAKTLLYYSARANHQASHDLGKALIDRIWNLYGADPRGVGVPETRSDYNRFDDPVFVPSNFTGTMANGDPINSSSTFISLRSSYRQDPAWPQVQSYLNGGPVPTFTYHRFWAQVDVATAMAVYDELF
jgi:Glycosyl hydrolase family 48